MKETLSIPAKTRARLAFPAPTGQRHIEIVKIASALTASGLNPEAVFHQIRPNYGPDLTDTEIRAVVRWAVERFGNRSGSAPNRNATAFPCGFHRNTAHLTVLPRRLPPDTGQLTARSTAAPEKAVARFLAGFRCEEADLWERSAVRPPDSGNRDAEALLAALYRPGERLNIVSAFAVSGGKPHPVGTGCTRNQAEWLSEIARNGPPVCGAGAWLRPNPVTGDGISDTDIAAFRFLLIESDAVSLPLQMAFFARLPLPISAIISSGGKSLHAWVKIETKSISDYRAVSARIYSALIDFGIDPANKNPSRLSRLPGVIRELGGFGEKRQKLLYLNPEPTGRRIIE